VAAALLAPFTKARWRLAVSAYAVGTVRDLECI
jgi:hypothetical protein